MKSDKDTLKRVHETRASVSHVFQTKWEEAKENSRFYRLLQYTDEQLQKATNQNRVPYVLDFISLALNTMIGDQRNNRTDIMYLPVEASDDMRVEVLNAVKDSVLRQNNFIFTESDIFQDGVVEKTGCLGYEWVMDKNPLGELKVFRIPPRQLTWDLNRRDFSLASAQWVSRTRLYGKRELARKYPDFKKDIERMDLTGVAELEEFGLDETYLKQILDTDLGACATVEMYERRYDMKFFIGNGDSFFDENYATQKEAERAIKEKLAYYEQALVPKFAANGQMPPAPPNLYVKGFSYPIITKTEVAHNLVFQDTEDTDLPDFPYDIYHPYWHDGEWWGVLDLYKDPQRFINKMFMLIDHQINTNTKGLLLVDDTVPEAQFQALKNAWSKTGGAEKIHGVGAGLVQHIKPDSFDPRLISAMDVAVQNLKEKSGGSNYLGQRESAGEAASAIRQRIERGSASSFVVFDNLTRFKKSVGEKIAWYLSTYMKAAQKVRIEGDELTEMARQTFPEWYKDSRRPGVGFLDINTGGQNSIENIKVDVIVDEVRHSVTKNQQILIQMSEMMRASPMLANTIPPQLIVELLDLPASTKRKMKQASEQLMQMEMQKAQSEMNKPASLSASLNDITLFQNDPQAQAQFASRFGVQLSVPVAQTEKDKSGEILLKAKLDQMEKDKDRELDLVKMSQQEKTKLIKILTESEDEHSRMKHEKEMGRGQNSQSDE